ncbi:MAG: hypothetical protein IJH40_07210 [Ruminococcus sp.]|uniref:hypothetical protein n=1 Tax=Ruminococcus sp. TaxID=41978 RepID=UPI002872D8FD|nr:hypothetical protein [Ruminococcus sp.]MBQ3285414.1 hypothetical protein [Ruminococcus sp.]
MTPKEALKLLKERDKGTSFSRLTRGLPEEYDHAIDTAIEALERLTPKPPRQKAVSSLSSKDKTIYKGFCPHCKDDNYVYSFHQCCNVCGQAIDWSEHNAEG